MELVNLVTIKIVRIRWLVVNVILNKYSLCFCLHCKIGKFGQMDLASYCAHIYFIHRLDQPVGENVEFRNKNNFT